MRRGRCRAVLCVWRRRQHRKNVIRRAAFRCDFQGAQLSVIVLTAFLKGDNLCYVKLRGVKNITKTQRILSRSPPDLSVLVHLCVLQRNVVNHVAVRVGEAGKHCPAHLRGKGSVLRTKRSTKFGQYFVRGTDPLSDGIVLICKHDNTQFPGGNKSDVTCKTIG